MAKQTIEDIADKYSQEIGEFVAEYVREQMLQGLALGYPPRSCEIYANCFRSEVAKMPSPFLDS